MPEIPAIEAVLIARPAPCPRCRGRGRLPAVSCNVCGFMERVTRAQEKPFVAACYSPEEVEGLTHFPACGHVLSVFFLTAGAFVCPECGKEGCEVGQVQVWHTEAEWERLDAEEAQERKQGASEAARVLSEQFSEHGRATGYSGAYIRRMLALITPICGAHCRTTGRPCPNRVVLGAMRCRLHGGLSTGPKTAEGRARIGASRRERAEKQRAKKAMEEKANEPCP